MEFGQALANLRQDLTGPILELEGYQNLGNFITDVSTCDPQFFGRLRESGRCLVETREHLLNGGFCIGDGLGIILSGLRRDVGRTTDGAVDDINFFGYLPASFS